MNTTNVFPKGFISAELIAIKSVFQMRTIGSYNHCKFVVIKEIFLASAPKLNRKAMLSTTKSLSIALRFAMLEGIKIPFIILCSETPIITLLGTDGFVRSIGKG